MGNVLKTIREIHHVGNDTVEQLILDAAAPALAAHGVRVIGISDAGKGYDMGRLNPPEAHVLACVSGHGRVLIDGEWQACRAGQAYVTPAFSTMAFQTIGRHRWRFAWIYLWPDHWPMSRPSPYVISMDPRQFVSSIEGLYREVTAAAPDIQLIDGWADLACKYARHILTAAGQPNPLWQLWATVDATLGERWTLDRLAAEASLAPEALRRLCHRTIQKSPMRQVTDLRMQRARSLLESTPAKTYAVAQNVGYQNVFAFSVAFKRWCGKTPNECRPR